MVYSTPSTSEMDNNPDSATKKKSKGRQRGAKKWTAPEYESLLDAVDDVMPTGAKLWEEVSAQMMTDGFNRTGDACKKRFEKLFLTPTPTGDASPPVHVQRSWDLKEKIERKEAMGSAGLNNDDDEDAEEHEDSSVSPALAATNLVDDEDGKNACRPLSKRRKLNSAIEKLKEPNEAELASLENQTKLVGIMSTVAESICNRSSANANMADKIEKMEKKMDSIADMFTSISEKLDNL